MKDFQNKVAVITGGASGIGRALAERSAKAGMKVVIADIEEGPLAQADKEMRTAGASVLAVRTDVSKADEVQALARETVDSFGAVHLSLQCWARTGKLSRQDSRRSSSPSRFSMRSGTRNCTSTQRPSFRSWCARG